MSDISAIGREKQHLRRAMTLARDALPMAARQDAAEALAGQFDHPLLRSALTRSSPVIAAYRAIRSEIDPLPLLRRLASAGAVLALPRITPEGLVFHRHAPDDALEPGPFGTLEPHPASPIVIPTLFLAPLLAFDREGGRLGYGGGYYDRAFAAFPMAIRIGLAYPMQEVPHVPREGHDAPLRGVITGG